MLCFNACLMFEKFFGNIFLEHFVHIALKLISITIFVVENVGSIKQIEMMFMKFKMKFK